MILTATFAPHVASYVHKSLSLMKDTRLLRMCVDRKNIFLARRPIKNSSSYEELNFVLPLSIGSPEDIPKTIIFMDSRPAVCKATDHLILRLSNVKLKLQNSANSVVAKQELSNDCVGDFSMALSLERREELLKKFREGECRILVATEGAGMGLDIPDVQRVIQWKCTKLLNIATYYQRAGRAGRSSHIQAVSILFYQQSLGGLAGSEYEIFTKDVNSQSGAEIMLLTQSFDSGRDEDAMIRKGKSSTRNMLENRVGSTTQNTQRQNNQHDSRRLICRGILTQIGTQGCMRDAILRYFDDTKLPDVEPNNCCDSCARNTNIPSNIRRLMPEYVEPELENINGAATSNILEPPETREPAPVPKPLPISKTQIHAVCDALKMLRDDILHSQWDSPDGDDAKNAIFRSTHFLSDKEISKISSQAHRIHDEPTLAKYLSTYKHGLQWAPIAPYVTDLLETIKYACALHPPPASDLLRRRPGRPRVQLSAEEEATRKEQARIARNIRQRERYALKKALSTALMQTRNEPNETAIVQQSGITPLLPDTCPPHTPAQAATLALGSPPGPLLVGFLAQHAQMSPAHAQLDAGLICAHAGLSCACAQSHSAHAGTNSAHAGTNSAIVENPAFTHRFTTSSTILDEFAIHTTLQPIIPQSATLSHPVPPTPTNHTITPLQETTNQHLNTPPKPKRSYKRKTQPGDTENQLHPNEPLPKRPRGRPRKNPIPLTTPDIPAEGQ